MGWLEMLLKKQPLSKLSSTSGIAAKNGGLVLKCHYYYVRNVRGRG